MTILILHLSDIHIAGPNDPILSKGADIARCTFPHLPSASHVFIVVSGDVANTGIADEYKHATSFLQQIQEVLVRESRLPVSILMAPGNHDCDFAKDSGTRRAVLQSLETIGIGNTDESMINTCTEVQQDFFAFQSSLESSNAQSGDNLWRTTRFQVGALVIQFECLNVAWVSKLKEQQGALSFPFERYEGQLDPGVSLNVVVMHHPFNWFSQAVYRPFRKFLRQRADILVTGHEHEGNVGLIEDAETGKGAFIEGCVLQHKGQLSKSSFNIVAIDLEKEVFASTRYVFGRDGYKSTEEGSWSAYRDFKTERSNPFEITQEFQRRLDDPGAFLKHPSGASVALSDIFVYPDLRKVDGSEGKRRTLLSSSLLRSIDAIDGFALLEGEEKSGRTSLLFQLFQHYHDHGLCPLLVEGKSLKRSHDQDIDSVVRRSIVEQYGKDALESFLQLERSKKVLLLDNFSDTPLKAADAQAALLMYLQKVFQYGVVTVDEIFEMGELLAVAETNAINATSRFRIQHFGYARRTELIRRWFLLGADGTWDEAMFVARCEQAERVMDVVMTKAVIPSIPLYLLTLLQSVEAGRSGDFKESALGYYYQYLLTEAFHQSGVKAEKLTELFQYSMHLAWRFHSDGKRELSQLELRKFNEAFSREWHTVDFEARLQTLLEARVLQPVGQDFGFRYPYIYYYLKGKYLSENLANISLREYVAHCCRHLYVRDNANTVLFLAHHTHDPFVVDSIVDALKELFRESTPVAFNGDAKYLDALIQDAPKLIYSGESPREHRQRASELRDELDSGEDGLVTKEENSDELSLVAQITCLFKTIEILGQVVKNQYAKIPRQSKQILIAELFTGPLRALRELYDYVGSNPDALLSELESALKKKGEIGDEDKRKQFARRIAAAFLQTLSFAFFAKAGQSVSADSLVEDIHEVVESNGTLSFRLIELFVRLDSPKPLPRSMLLDLYTRTRDDLMPSRLLRLMVLNRLYMFRTTERDMQWLNAELNLDIEVQHSISYKETRQRRLKGSS